MRNYLTLFLLFMGPVIYAQTMVVTGDYYLKWECDSHQIEYKLSLQEEGSYELNTYTTERSSASEVVEQQEAGTWRSEGDVLTFTSKAAKDFDEEYTVNLNGSIARLMPKSPSENTDGKTETVLIFDTSKIYCIEGLEFVKLSGQ
jgi:hypothetical protein